MSAMEGEMHAADPEPSRTLRPDSKGRITLGRITQGISGYKMEQAADGTIILRPVVEVPAREAWLFKNPKALKAVREGLGDLETGRVKSLGSFARFAEADDE